MEDIYGFTSAVLADPPPPEMVEALSGLPEPEGVDDPLIEEAFRELKEWADAVDDPEESSERLEKEHTSLFLGPRPALQVHESFYADDFMGEPLAAVAEDYSSLGIAPAQDLREEVDHAAVELAVLRHLVSEGRTEDRQEFLESHGWWFDELAEDLRREAKDGFYSAVARLIKGAVDLDAKTLGAGIENASHR